MIQMLESRQYTEALALFSESLKQEGLSRLSDVRKFMDRPEGQIRDLLKIMDTAMMDTWSRIVARFSHRRLNSPNTLVWHCEELIDDQKVVEAEILLKRLEEDEPPAETAEKLYFNLAVLLVRMRRFHEACTYMEKCERISKEPMNVRWAYYFLLKDDWENAIRLLERGKQDREDGVYAYLLLAQHYSLRGMQDAAEACVAEGLQSHPSYPKLLAEKIRILYNGKRWPEMRAGIAELLAVSPFHDLRDMCDYYQAVSLYEEEQWTELEEHLAAHPALRKIPRFKNYSGDAGKPCRMLVYKRVIQKYNYCLPAGSEMLFSMFSTEIGQDEVAEKIFESDGSRVSRAIDFFRENGFHCVLFHGDEARYKRLIDVEAGVLITLDYPTEAHVQLLAGYDDRLGVFFIQDPNLGEPHAVEYSGLEREFGNNRALSVAVVPVQNRDKLAFLDEQEHAVLARILHLTENCDRPLSREDTEFLRTHLDRPVVSVYGAKYLAGMLEEDVLTEMVRTVDGTISDPLYRDLAVALAYTQAGKDGLANARLEGMSSGSRSADYWYLKGRVNLNLEEFRRAARDFEQAVLLEPDRAHLWSYRGLALSDAGESEEGLKFSEIALDILAEDDFTQASHGRILFDAGRYGQARECFTRAIRLKNDQPHFWYERARCDMQIGRFHQAERGFSVAIRLDPSHPVLYKQLADIWEFVRGDTAAAESVLKRGLAATEESGILLGELGELHERAGNLKEAQIWYTKALEKEPENPIAALNVVSLLKEVGQTDAFFREMDGLEARFGEDSEFLINGGKLIFEAAGDSGTSEHRAAQGLSWMEKGLHMAGSALEEALELYVSLIGDTPHYRRGAAFLEEQQDRTDGGIFLCHAGILHEQNGYPEKAKGAYGRALERKEEVQPLYLLGELHVKMEDMEKAASYYERVLRLNPSHGPALLDLAGIFRERGEDDKALELLLKAFRLNPRAVDVEAAAELMDRAQLEHFLEEFQSLDKKGNGADFLYSRMAVLHGKLGSPEKEDEYLAKALKASPESPELLHQQAKAMYRRGEAKSARKLLLGLMEAHYDDREYYDTLIGFLGKSAGKIKPSLDGLKLSREEKSRAFMYGAAAFEKALQPTLEAHSQREEKGLIRKLKNLTHVTIQIGVLVDLYESAIKCDRENMEAAVWLADFYMAVSLPEDAIKTLVQTLGRHWDDEIAYRLALLYINEREPFSERKQAIHIQKAQELLENLMNRRNDPADLHLLGYSLFLQGSWPEAETAFLQCLEVEPEIENGFLLLGKTYAEMERYRDAEQAMRKAVELFPDDPEGWDELGILFGRQGKNEEALRYAEHALEADPAHLFARYNRACYLSQLGRFEECVQELEKVFELDEDGFFIELAGGDEDLDPLRQSGYFAHA
ncbi:tetratricopeptide repeat protein [Edaphobacillus lindanitolerans]|uniref:Flp pilus assembly protein TadD, contains TPR repeats n=1 Tax=Edaphobacillus lindanitolerans TaxID=550447 RepID=A0A1U7PTG4_9BACI|nr:tetratricopeptide repeat protein [Edaphobacillus lindanitolerans]SIT92585.1 Flp pilus assembly protein TadD, contains TPR repeats [Edaphobacillus lindanitolerans]